jgi:hypothetical protein
MKTTILTIAIAVSTLFGISQSTYAATRNTQTISTLLTDVSNISEIEVHGNVQLYLSDGTTDKVKVYNNYYAENAMVQDQNGVLRISSYSPEKLVVWVTVSQLAKLTAFDNAEVKTFGKFSTIDLDVKLFNHASAKLDVDTFTTTISLNDRTMADLTGNVTEGKVEFTPSSFANTTNLTASHLVKTVKLRKMDCARPTELASL